MFHDLNELLSPDKKLPMEPHKGDSDFEELECDFKDETKHVRGIEEEFKGEAPSLMSKDSLIDHGAQKRRQ